MEQRQSNIDNKSRTRKTENRKSTRRKYKKVQEESTKKYKKKVYKKQVQEESTEQSTQQSTEQSTQQRTKRTKYTTNMYLRILPPSPCWATLFMCNNATVRATSSRNANGRPGRV
jgi:hypothetical protein